MARVINHYNGSSIGFWDVGGFDETTIDLFLALNNQLPSARAGIQKIEAAKQKYFAQLRKH